MDGHVIVYAVLGTAIPVCTLLVVGMLLCVYALAYHIGQYLKDRQMHILALALGHSTL